MKTRTGWKGSPAAGRMKAKGKDHPAHPAHPVPVFVFLDIQWMKTKSQEQDGEDRLRKLQ
jgi:hypothetical protein